MVEIKLHNTATRSKEVFTPIDPENVRMYVCGPTVYDRAHLGNARPVVVFDVLYRLLRHVYGAEHVTYVRNFTDVDDKIIQRANESGVPIDEITSSTTQWYLDDMGALGALEPDQMPRATQHIGDMVTMIEGLIASGHAYEAKGHVLFSVESYGEYGKLSGRSVDDMIAGARVEVAPYKRNPMDFVLWKPAKDAEPGWDSPWGRGRPGWHIECSAMSYELLGETFDIHGGGNDLMFPHHENEIAQSKCAHEGAGFANVWLHNEMLQVEGKKMSKSLGNFFTVRDLLLAGLPGHQKMPGAVIRFVFLQTHYRKPMDWRQATAVEAVKRLDIWSSEVSAALNIKKEFQSDEEEFVRAFLPASILEAVADDLNTSLAMTNLVSIGKQIEGSSRGKPTGREVEQVQRELVAGAAFLGLNLFEYTSPYSTEVDLSGLAAKLVSLRATAMATKDFSEVDGMKAALIAAGVEVRMSKDGVVLHPGTGFDPSKLEGLS